MNLPTVACVPARLDRHLLDAVVELDAERWLAVLAEPANDKPKPWSDERVPPQRRART